MKRCPECRRDYYDDTLLYCLDDGNALLEGPASVSSTGDEPQTAILHSTGGTDEAATRQQLLTTSGAPGASPSTAAVHTRPLSFTRNAVLVVILLLCVAAAGFFGYRYLWSNAVKPQRAATDLKIQRLTGDGNTVGAVISPDGKFLAFTRAENEKVSLWVKQIQTNSNVQIVGPGEFRELYGLLFTPEGSFIFFRGITGDSTASATYKVPVLGGNPVKVMASMPAFSSDGRQMAFTRFDEVAKEDWVIIANADGSNERKLVARSGKQSFESRATWSRDDKFLAIVVIDEDLPRDAQRSIAIISLADGALSELGDKWADVFNPVWHPSNDAVMVVGRKGSDDNQDQLWEVEYPSGVSRRITNSLTLYAGLSLTADGQSAVLTEYDPKSSVWVSHNTDPNFAKEITRPTGSNHSISWTPDKKIVYISNASGNTEIWSIDADGKNAKQLTNDRLSKRRTAVSPDGRYIAYVIDGNQLIRMDMNGGNPGVLVRGQFIEGVDFSGDSKWIIYPNSVEGEIRIFRIPVAGGDPQSLTGALSWAFRPKYSPDGLYFAFPTFDEAVKRWQISIFPAEGGQAVKTIDLNSDYASLAWTPDGKGLTYNVNRGAKGDLWFQPIGGGEPNQLTNFDPPEVHENAYSLDGKQIALVRVERHSNAIMITDFR